MISNNYIPEKINEYNVYYHGGGPRADRLYRRAYPQGGRERGGEHRTNLEVEG